MHEERKYDDSNNSRHIDCSCISRAFLKLKMRIWKNGHYVIIWFFSISDSFVRCVPLLMLISFLNGNGWNRLFDNNWPQFASFTIFALFYGGGFVFEFRILNKEFIIEKMKNGDANKYNKYNKYHEHICGFIYSFYCVISNSLYLMVLMNDKLPHLKYKVKNSKYFVKYQIIRIVASVFILLLLSVLQLIAWSNHFTWTYLACFFVFIAHVVSFYFSSKSLC